MKIIKAYTLADTQAPDLPHVWIYAPSCKFSHRGYFSVAKAKKRQILLRTHHVPFFLSLHAHVTIENTIEDVWNLFFGRFELQYGKFNIRIPYHLIMGLLSSQSMKRILSFIRGSLNDKPLCNGFECEKMKNCRYFNLNPVFMDSSNIVFYVNQQFSEEILKQYLPKKVSVNSKK